MSTLYRSWVPIRNTLSLRRALILTLVFGVMFGATKRSWLAARAAGFVNDPISTNEFSRIIRDFSEDEAFYFPEADNYISNELGYANAVDELKRLPVRGDAYIGVGPEQNFTYIAKLRPRIAFILDIRRQAAIQHLMYKSIFHMAQDRAVFLKLLLSRPLTGINAPGPDASVAQLATYFVKAKADEDIFESNLAEIERLIRDEFKVPMSSKDHGKLRRIYGAFKKRGLHISYSSHPTLKELMEQKGRDGMQQHFLATRKDYEFLRDLQLQNRIIPIIGDFAGSKAFRAIAGYLRENSHSVAVFYASSVEEILDVDGKFGRYAANIGELPITPGSYILRYLAGERPRIMLFQQMTTFFKYYEQSSLYLDHHLLLRTDCIPVESK